MLFPATTTEAGMCFAFPNVCKVPAFPTPIPTPMPSLGKPQDADAGTCSSKVKILNKPVLIQTSEIPRSSGDEAGTAGGVVSGTNMGPVVYKLASNCVKAEGEGIVYLTCMTAQNGSNANMPAGAQIAPSQDKVLVMP